MKKQIEILMATYNGQDYIEEQLKSLLSQTYQNFKIIISDDCSTDNTIEIIKKVQSHDDRIELHTNESNVGFNKNFEKLCSYASGDFCMFCDQDDVWLKDKIQKMYDCMIKNNASLVYCDMKVVDSNLKTVYNSFHRLIGRINQCKKYDDFRLLKIENAISGCSMMVRTDVLKKCIPFVDSVIVYDWWISLVASQYGKIIYIDECLQLYRQHQKNSIGAFYEREKLPFEKYRSEIVDFKYRQYKDLNANVDIFFKDKEYIISMYKYLEKIRYNKKRKRFQILKLYDTESISRRLKMLLLYNFPRLAKLVYNMKYRGVKK